MKLTHAALPLLLALTFAGCPATCQSPNPGTVDGGVSPGTTFKNCSDQAAVQAAQQILPIVVQALATGNYVVALAALVAQYGQAEVVCAVQLAVNEIQSRLDNTPATAAPDPLLVTEHANGVAWLASPAGQFPAAK